MKRRSLWAIVKLLIAMSLFVILVQTTAINMQLFVHFIAHPLLFLIGILLLLFAMTAAAWRWFILNQTQALLMGFRQTLRATYIGTAFNFIIFGTVGGDVVRILYLLKALSHQHATIPTGILTKEKALLTVLFDRMIGLFVVFVMIVGAVWYTQIARSQPVLQLMAWICLGASLGLGGFFMFFRTVARWMTAWSFASRFTYLKAVTHFLLPKKVFLSCSLLSLLAQSVIICLLMALAKLLQLPAIPIVHYALALGIAQIAGLLPLTPGGLGVGEAAFSQVLLWLNPGVVLPYATVFLAYRLTSALVSLPIAVSYFVLKRPLFKREFEKPALLSSA